MTKFSFAGDKCIKTEVREFPWTKEHRNMLFQIHNSGSGVEFRDNPTDYESEMKLCKDLENMGLAHLAHSTFYKCWRLTEEGRSAIKDTTWETLTPRRFNLEL